MDTALITLQIIGLALFGWMIQMLKDAQKGYADQKGKNKALSEDIKAITKEVETVKTLLSDKSHFKRWRIEREHKAHVEIWEKHCDVWSRFWELHNACCECSCGMEDPQVAKEVGSCWNVSSEFQDLYIRYSLSMATPVREHLVPFNNTLSGFIGDVNARQMFGLPPFLVAEKSMEARDKLRTIIRDYYEDLEKPQNTGKC